MDGGGNVRDASVGWFLGRLRILEERIRSNERELAEMRQEHSLLRRRLRDKGAEPGSLEGENPSLTNENSRPSARDTETKGDESSSAKWAISAELPDLVVESPVTSWSPPSSGVRRSLSAHERGERSLSNVLGHRSSAPHKLYSWEAIMERDRIRAEEISKLNRKYRWFTQAAEELAERMMKAKRQGEALKPSNCTGNSEEETTSLHKTTSRMPSFAKAAVIRAASPPTMKAFPNGGQENGALRPKIDNGKVEECGMQHIIDRFRIHWNATFASATLITETAQSIGASFAPGNMCSSPVPSLGSNQPQQQQQHKDNQHNQIKSFLSKDPKRVASTMGVRKPASLKESPFFANGFSRGIGDPDPFNDKVRASMEYACILRTIRESDGCSKAD